MESTCPNIHKKTKTFYVFLVLLTLAHNQSLGPQQFCHSNCISYIGACHDSTPNGCYVCADSIFKPKDFTNPSNPCIPKGQRKILFKELDSTAPMSLDGFTTSNSGLFTCSNFSFSGRYINSDYIERNFTGITTEHFELVIRFNVGYFGSWGGSDNLQLEVQDGVSTNYYSWGYNCGSNNVGGFSTSDTQNLCSSQGTDCIKIKQFTIQHNSSYIYLKWNSLSSQNDPNIQSWGIKDIIITAKTCHRYCNQCFGESVSQCLTCSPGFFLRGNTCVEKCPSFSIPSTQECVQSCPIQYYHNKMNDFCEPCMDGCSLCSGQTNCLLWTNSLLSSQGGLWYEKIELWIIMIIAGVGLIGLLMWKLVLKKYFDKAEESGSGSDGLKEEGSKSLRSSKSGQLNQVKNSSNNLANQLWIVDAERLDPVKIDVRRRKKRKAEIQQSMNNSEINL